MQLGRAIIGAIIGAAVGIGVLVAVYLLFGIDKVWLAIVVALLTGMGVRMMVSTWGHASYLRGAMTGVLALMAYLAAWYVVAGLAQQRASAQTVDRTKTVAAAKAPADADGDATTPADEAPAPAKAPDAARRPSGAGMQKAAVRRDFSTMDFLWLCVAALVAYELGRGTAAKPVVVGEETTTEVPVHTHPDA